MNACRFYSSPLSWKHLHLQLISALKPLGVSRWWTSQINEAVHPEGRLRPPWRSLPARQPAEAPPATLETEFSCGCPALERVRLERLQSPVFPVSLSDSVGC